jgi:hypothetical protein
VSIRTFARLRVRPESDEPALVKCTAARRDAHNLSLMDRDTGDYHRKVKGIVQACRDRRVVLSSGEHSDLGTSGFRATVSPGPVRTLEGASCVCKSSETEIASHWRESI